MKKLSDSEAELKKCAAYEKSVYYLCGGLSSRKKSIFIGFT